MSTVTEISQRVGLPAPEVSTILAGRQDAATPRDTVDAVFRAAVELGYDFGAADRRRHPRRKVSLSTRVTLLRDDGSVIDTGKATIGDLSISGARIVDVSLERGEMPSIPCGIVLEPLEGDRSGAKLSGRTVRRDDRDGGGWGVQFSEFDTGA